MVYTIMNIFLGSYLEGQTVCVFFLHSNFFQCTVSILPSFSSSLLSHFLPLPPAVRGLGSDFVLGYIQAMDGEKDPRNLVIVFSTVPTIIQHLPFGEMECSCQLCRC